MFFDLGGRGPWNSVACLRLHSENRTWDTRHQRVSGRLGVRGGVGSECMECLRSTEVQALFRRHATLGTF